MSSYAEKLRDPRWQKKRLELLEAAGWQCSMLESGVCRNTVATLHVHHKLYLRNKDPWDYEDWAYSVLCEYCHKVVQQIMEDASIAIAKSSSLSFVVNQLVNLKSDDNEELYDSLGRDLLKLSILLESENKRIVCEV